MFADDAVGRAALLRREPGHEPAEELVHGMSTERLLTNLVGEMEAPNTKP